MTTTILCIICLILGAYAYRRYAATVIADLQKEKAVVDFDLAKVREDLAKAKAVI